MTSLLRALNWLKLPKRPPGAFNIFLQDFIVSLKQKSKFKSFYDSENQAMQEWKTASLEIQSKYESLASLKFTEYEKEFSEISSKGEAIRDQIEEIQKRGDITAIVKKKISPYRVFKKEIASHIKIEFPNMKSQER